MDNYHTLSFHLKAVLDDNQTGFFECAFDEDPLSYSSKKNKDSWDFLWVFEDEPSPNTVIEKFQNIALELNLSPALFQNFIIEKLEDKDWLAESYRALPPFTIGSFFIYGSHYNGDKPNGFTPLMIEAATAFGSGEHGTTSACILAIEDVYKKKFKPKNILDMGCGSGILACVAAILWADIQVYAAENDPECVVVSKRHITANAISNIKCFQSEGYEETSPVWDNAPYDFIIANILAGPLIDMATEQSKAVAKDGYLILSGTLNEQADRVLNAYTPFGFKLVGEFPNHEWMTLLLQKRS